MIPTELRQLTDAFFDSNAHKFDLTENSGCGQYMESLIPYCQTHGYPKVGFLKKNPGQTNYNGHANDAFLYADGTDNPNGLYQAVDVITSAESKPPYGPGHNPPSKGWSVDEPRYTLKDWSKEPNSNPTPIAVVPYVPYNENGFQRLKNMLAHDYNRRPQGADFDVSIWAGRYFHNCYMGPNGTPLGEDGALHRIKPELCGALGIPMDNYYGE